MRPPIRLSLHREKDITTPFGFSLRPAAHSRIHPLSNGLKFDTVPVAFDRKDFALAIKCNGRESYVGGSLDCLGLVLVSRCSLFKVREVRTVK